MKRIVAVLVGVALMASCLWSQEKKEEKSSNLRQFYSGKFGFFQPSDGLNNGLLLGIDGITEFVHYDFFLSGVIDLYQKQTISIFRSPQPDVSRQAMFLLPLHINVGIKLFEAQDADTRAYAGVGGGYYLYFYSVEYTSSSSGGGGLLGPVSGLNTQTDSKNGGNIFGSAFVRFLIGQVFVEPRAYFATKREGTVSGNYTYVVNPTGFAVTLGFQYH
ncbi:MAG: hypothetical protein WBD36_03635 [Bacteroidota bacterium]